MNHRDVLWITTPGEIARYCEGLPKGTVARVSFHSTAQST
jgi:hypothetical protein